MDVAKPSGVNHCHCEHGSREKHRTSKAEHCRAPPWLSGVQRGCCCCHPRGLQACLRPACAARSACIVGIALWQRPATPLSGACCMHVSAPSSPHVSLPVQLAGCHCKVLLQIRQDLSLEKKAHSKDVSMQVHCHQDDMMCIWRLCHHLGHLGSQGPENVDEFGDKPAAWFTTCGVGNDSTRRMQARVSP